MTMYSVREFRKGISKALDEADACTQVEIKRGCSVYTLRKEEVKGGDLCTPKEKKGGKACTQVKTMVEKSEEKIEILRGSVMRYGCGCEKDGKVLCSKHGRV
jgi:hypothetical protein